MTAYSIALAPERFGQLQSLANVEGRTMADTVATLLDAAIEGGRLPDALPGWNIESRDNVATLDHPASGVRREMSVAEAHALADTLAKMSAPKPRLRGHLDLDTNLEVRRKGNGVILVDTDTDQRITVALNVAADICRRLARLS